MLERWQTVLKYVPRYRPLVVGGVAALVVSNVAQATVPALMRRALLAIETPLEAGGLIDRSAVARWAFLALGVAIVGAAGAFLKRQLLMRMSRHVETDLRRDLFRHIQRLPMRQFDRLRTGDLMSRATADIETARMAIGPALMYLSDAILKFGTVLAFMIVMNPTLTAYLLLPLGGICAGLVVIAPRIHRASRAVQDQLAGISARAQESFAGGRVVKTYATEDREAADLETLGQDYIGANLRLARVRGITIAWVGVMSAGGMAVILGVGGRQAIEGRFDIAGVLAFFSYLVMLAWPMMAFGFVVAMIQRGAAGVDRLREIFAHPEEESGTESGAGLRGEIELRGLAFAHNGAPVLRDVSVRVPAGATLGIVGPTGSGKSTLVSLLPRLYDPPRGTLFLDGRDVHEIPLAELRKDIAFVPQEPFLFSTTIRENVAFGNPDADAAALEAAVRDAHLHRDVEGFPKGLDTVVGERGVTLSGGQKQRATLARALASDAPILVLDDSLSAVDSETETAILSNLRRVRQGRTALVVAHRISAVRDADHILYLRDGRIAEQGTHAELVALGGAYAHLARMQELEAEIEAMD